MQLCGESCILYPPCLLDDLSPPDSHGALQAVQNKLILDEYILKLDQPVSSREASATGLT